MNEMIHDSLNFVDVYFMKFNWWLLDNNLPLDDWSILYTSHICCRISFWLSRYWQWVLFCSIRFSIRFSIRLHAQRKFICLDALYRIVSIFKTQRLSNIFLLLLLWRIEYSSYTRWSSASSMVASLIKFNSVVDSSINTRSFTSLDKSCNFRFCISNSSKSIYISDTDEYFISYLSVIDLIPEINSQHSFTLKKSTRSIPFIIAFSLSSIELSSTSAHRCKIKIKHFFYLKFFQIDLIKK